MTDPVERVAEAIRDEMGRLGFDIDAIPHDTQEVVEALAQAAIDALGLVEEWTVRFSEPEALAKPTDRPPSPEIVERTRKFFPDRTWVSRLVGPWVEVSDGD